MYASLLTALYTKAKSIIVTIKHEKIGAEKSAFESFIQQFNIFLKSHEHRKLRISKFTVYIVD